MNTRVIDDPSTVGWELDPDTGRWMWTGSGGGSAGAGMVIQPTEPTDPVTGLQWMDSTTGRIWIWDDDKWLEFPAGGSADAGEGSSSNPWELLHEVDMINVSMLDYPDIFSDDYLTYRVELRDLFFDTGSGGQFLVKVYSEGALVTGSPYSQSVFDPNPQYYESSSNNVIRLNATANSNLSGSIDCEITFCGARPRLAPSCPKQPYLGIQSVFLCQGGKRREVVHGSCYMQIDWGDWDGFQIYNSGTAPEIGKALIYGLKRD